MSDAHNHAHNHAPNHLPSDAQSDVQSLIPPSTHPDGVTRREFIQTAVGVGFAAAVLPVSAQTITTPSDGLLTETITLTINGTAVPVYRAQPLEGKNLPVVLVISEIFGVHAHIADVARRFAQLGYMALAPELFVRQGDPRAYPVMADLMSNIIRKTPDAEVMDDLDHVVQWAGQNGGNLNRLALNGFCWGGRITWLYCAHNPHVKAGVAWYGRLEGETSPFNPVHPIQIASTLKTPVLGLYGGQDTGISLDAIERMKQGLALGSSGSEFVIYPEAPHAFHADYRPVTVLMMPKMAGCAASIG